MEKKAPERKVRLQEGDVFTSMISGSIGVSGRL